jgi:predicted Zn-dependent protease
MGSRLKPLEPPDRLRLQDAEGWIGLGDYASANDELEQISPASRDHPDVLQLRWRMCAKAEKWDTCLDIATALTTLMPERRFGWIHRAHSLHRLGRTQEAKDLLVSVVNDFGSNSTVPFHLARYCCGLGQADEAFRWLEKAVAAADNPEKLLRLRKQVLEDPALELLRKKL